MTEKKLRTKLVVRTRKVIEAEIAEIEAKNKGKLKSTEVKKDADK